MIEEEEGEEKGRKCQDNGNPEVKQGAWIQNKGGKDVPQVEADQVIGSQHTG